MPRIAAVFGIAALLLTLSIPGRSEEAMSSATLHPTLDKVAVDLGAASDESMEADEVYNKGVFRDTDAPAVPSPVSADPNAAAPEPHSNASPKTLNDSIAIPQPAP